MGIVGCGREEKKDKREGGGKVNNKTDEFSLGIVGGRVG